MVSERFLEREMRRLDAGGEPDQDHLASRPLLVDWKLSGVELTGRIEDKAEPQTYDVIAYDRLQTWALTFDGYFRLSPPDREQAAIELLASLLQQQLKGE
jgi:hypothetical protein